MKLLISVLILYSTLFSAQIDTKLFEGTVDEYYDEIAKNIDTAAKKGVRSKDITNEERALLSKLKKVSAQNVKIDEYDLKALTYKNVDIKKYQDTLAATAQLQIKQNSNKNIKTDLQAKLLTLRQNIENITEENKASLLSYQLEFAYYKIQQKNLEQRISLIQTQQKELSDVLVNTIERLKCISEAEFKRRLQTLDTKIQNSLKQRNTQQNEYEKALIEDNSNTAIIGNILNNMNTKYQVDISEKLTLKIQQTLCSLKNQSSSDFYKYTKELDSLIAEITTKNEQELFSEQINILKSIAKNELGETKLFFGTTLQESKEVLGSLKEFFTSPIFIFNERTITIFSLFKAVVLITFGFIFGIFYKRWILKLSRKWSDLSMMSIRLASNIGYYLIVLIFIIIAISSLGIDMSSISLIAGALSIGIGFGLQTVVSNLIAGIILMFERTIRIGDTIEINDILFGTVTDMRIRSTTIKTFDNIDIIVPNSSFIQNNVINWTLEDRSRRIHIPFSVAYGTEIKDVKKAVLDALLKSDLNFIANDEDKKPDIRMTLMNSSSVDMELVVWVEWDVKLKKNSLKSDFLILIYDALRANDINIPFPQLDIHMKREG